MMSALALSSDSLIVAGALSSVVRARHMAPLVVLFGLCDGAASAIGPALAVQTIWPGSPAAMLLIVWGGLLLPSLSAPRPWRESPLWAYALAPLLAIDNLMLRWDDPVLAGAVSSAMAAAGFLVGAALLRRPVASASGRRLAGVALATAGLWMGMS